MDVIDFQLDRGFRSLDPAYLRRIKMLCHRHGLPIGFVGIGHGFVDAAQTSNQGRIAVLLAEKELQRRIDEAKEAVDIATLMGAPLIRLFGGSVPEGSENREVLWKTMINTGQ